VTTDARGGHPSDLLDDPPTRPSEGVDPLSFAVFQEFRRAVRAHGQLMLRILAEEGTHPGQAFCLRMLARHDGLSQRDLAESLHLSRPTVTAMLQRMEKSGTIERHSDPDDQRVTRVHLTEDGRRLEVHLRSALAAYSGRVLDPIPARDRAELQRLLGVMADNMTAALDERVDGAAAHR
jgi:DNA-binding MarR family transcriptional regulator